MSGSARLACPEDAHSASLTPREVPASPELPRGRLSRSGLPPFLQEKVRIYRQRGWMTPTLRLFLLGRWLVKADF